MEWLVYDIELDIVGFGDTAESARLDALRRSNVMPADYGVESWDDHDVSGDNWGPDGWSTATQERYREAVIEAD